MRPLFVLFVSLGLVIAFDAMAQEPVKPAPEAQAAEGGAFSLLPGSDRVDIPRLTAGEGGLTGLDRLTTASIGPLGTLRLRLGLTHFETPDFPVDDTANVFTAADFALSGTPLEFLELAFAVRATSNANDGTRPRVLQSVGDATFGFKLGWTFWEVLSVAATGEAFVVGVVGGGGVAGDATSYRWRALVTGDFFRAYEVPVRFTLSLGYEIENREALLAEQVNEPGVIEEWGLQVARYDRIMAGLGLELPFSRFGGAYLEYHIGTPIQVEPTRRGPGTDDFTFDTVPHWVTPGLRTFPVPELAVDFALRLGISESVYTGVPATPPWQFMMGLTYTLDPRPDVIERTVEAKAPPPPALARIGGRVFDAATRKPIVGAIVSYPDRADLSPQVTGPDGRFAGYRLERAGTLNLEAVAEGHTKATAQVEVAPGGQLDVPFTLAKAPAPAQGSVEVKLVDAVGTPVAGTVRISAAGGPRGDARATAPFRSQLAPGRYEVVGQGPGGAPVSKTIDVAAGQTVPVRLTLADAEPAPKAKTPPVKTRTAAKASATRKGSPKGKRPKRKGKARLPTIGFAAGSATLSGSAKKTLDGIARTLKKTPSIERVRIAAYTDSKGDPKALTRLSNQRARVVKSYLTGKGVAARRLQARGYGAKKPVAPNITARGRARNNRVEFRVLGGGR